MKLIRTTLAALLVLLTLLSAAPEASAAAAPLWSRMVGLPQNFSPSAIAQPVAEVAWVAGSTLNRVNGVDRAEGSLLRLVALDGHWQVVASYAAPQALRGVLALGPDEAWAVGEQGTILHLRNGNPIIEQPPVLSAALLQSVAVDGDTVWAVGYISARGAGESVVARRTAAGWERVQGLPFDNLALSRVVARDGAVWVAGGRLLRLSAGSWADMTPPICSGEPNCNVVVTDIALHPDGTLLLVGMLNSSPSSSFIVETRGSEQRLVWRSSAPGAPEGVLHRIGIAADGTALAVGTGTRSLGKFSRGGLVLSRTPTGWQEIVAVGNVSSLREVGVADTQHALLLDIGRSILTYGYPYQAGLALDVTLPVVNTNQPGVDFFPETGHTLRGEFRNRWVQFGGLAQFGYPRTEEVQEVNPTDGQTYVVQYFERARFELHPDLAPPYNVLLGLLGADKAAGREREEPFVPRAGSGPGYAPETGHTIAPEFYGYWQAHGGLAIFGYPLSEAFQEVNPADGQTYVVQYFERNRFEFHPELPEPYRVSLGLLGNEALVRARVL